MTLSIHFRHGPAILADDRLGRIDDARRVGIRDIELVGAGHEARAAMVADEGNRIPLHRPVQGQFRFRTEAGHDKVVGDSERSDTLTAGRKIVEEDGRGNAKTSIGLVVIKHVRERSIRGCGRAFDLHGRGTAGEQRHSDGCGHASRRQGLSHGNSCRVAPIDTAAEHQGAGFEFETIGVIAAVVIGSRIEGSLR